MIEVPCPWFPQRDNALNPAGTCNMTSTAMVLRAFGVAGDGNGQLEDQLVRECLRRGIDYHDASSIKAMIEWKGHRDRFETQATWQEVIQHLRAGGLCIMHGWFTRSGHIPVIVGVDEARREFILNDPAGEWLGGGYGSLPNGERRRYSYRLLDAVGRADSYEEAMEAYRSGRPIPAYKKTLWMHFASR